METSEKVMPEKASKKTAKEVASVDIKRKISKNREYRLSGKYKESPWLKLQSSDNPGGSRLLWFDEEKQKYRSLRYVINHESPFVDDQEGHEVVQESVLFERGHLGVDKHEVALASFLDKHPKNKANGGSLFYEYDPEVVAKQEVDYLKIEAEAMALAFDVDINTASAIMRPKSGEGIHTMKTEMVTRELLMFAKKDPEGFIERANYSNLMVEYIAYTSVDFGILKLTDQNQILRWADNGQKLLSIPFGEDPQTFITNWFTTDDGLAVMNKVTQKLKK